MTGALTDGVAMDTLPQTQNEPDLSQPEAGNEAAAKLLARLRRDEAFMCLRVAHFLNRLKVDQYPKGTVFAIDLVTGGYEKATTRIDGILAFEKRFGRGVTVGWLHEVGGRIYLGGGLP
jgi:hypothetical protein